MADGCSRSVQGGLTLLIFSFLSFSLSLFLFNGFTFRSLAKTTKSSQVSFSFQSHVFSLPAISALLPAIEVFLLLQRRWRQERNDTWGERRRERTYGTLPTLSQMRIEVEKVSLGCTFSLPSLACVNNFLEFPSSSANCLEEGLGFSLSLSSSHRHVTLDVVFAAPAVQRKARTFDGQQKKCMNIRHFLLRREP